MIKNQTHDIIFNLFIYIMGQIKFKFSKNNFRNILEINNNNLSDNI